MPIVMVKARETMATMMKSKSRWDIHSGNGLTPLAYCRALTFLAFSYAGYRAKKQGYIDMRNTTNYLKR